MKRLLDILMPLAVLTAFLGFWEWKVAHDAIPAYVLPAPSAIAAALAANFASLMGSLATTLTVTVLAFIAATVSALLLAILNHFGDMRTSLGTAAYNAPALSGLK